MLKPTIPLSHEQNTFLLNLNNVTLGSLWTDPEYWMQRIANEGGARDIYRTEAGKPVLYLRRHYLYRGPDREAMIHQFFLGDKGPLHDHPAASWGRILRVGYYERLCQGLDENGITYGEYNADRKPGEWSYRPASNENHDDFESFHKVKLRNPKADAGNVITFFVMEKRNANSWGFRANDGKFVPFAEMNKAENTEKVQSSPDDFGYGWFPVRKHKLTGKLMA
jgi:hypothetical protein